MHEPSGLDSLGIRLDSLGIRLEQRSMSRVESLGGSSRLNSLGIRLGQGSMSLLAVSWRFLDGFLAARV